MQTTSVALGLVNGILTAGMFLWSGFANAQVTPDATLNTTVSQSGNNFTITNGSAAGSNLFHSFREFSVPTGGSATFNLINTPNISTIFSRVTGGSISQIDGVIKTINSSNPVSLFLLNPSGIIFGANAQLNIGGSFVGTTANSIKFADGAEFSAIGSQAAPLLSINVPVGLQLGSNPAPITVQGIGYSLTTTNASALLPITRIPSSTELSVQPGKTLALVGGNLDLNGATLRAEQGRVELGSVGSAGLVSLMSTAQGYTLGYRNVQRFGDIHLAQRSLLDISGVNAGSVQVQGQQIQFTDGSLVLAQNFGNLPGGDIRFQATEAIDLIGTTPDAKIKGGVHNEAFGIGASGNISVITPRLTLKQGAALNNLTFGVGPSGNIQIDAMAIDISGFSPINPGVASNINTTTLGTGNAGNININAPIIVGLENSDIVANAVRGRGGNIQITTQGIFGLKFRDQLTPDNDITASSQLGVNGNVQVNTIGVDPNSGLVQLPANITNPAQQIATGCSTNQGSRFVATGRGGVPQNPNQQITSDRTWDDVRDLSAYRKTGNVTPQTHVSPKVLVEATSCYRNADGKIELIAAPFPTYVQQSLTCAASAKS
ncbi:MAG: filamentous hemagglutinin N-terminal domain-containing protein [Nostoc sp.]|uniref:filamentous hemagglutinin N-terminal domain-containing protein n=1 Tax=Nostoc sp. TaxID=1180 RepID=UPI002FEFA299